MAAASQPDVPTTLPARSLSILARWPTGAKVFAILGIALLPLALIVVIAAFQTTRIVDLESRGRLRLAAVESSRALAIELLGDLSALRAALAAIERDPADGPTCARLRGVFAQAVAAGARVEVRDSSGTVRCGDDTGVPEWREDGTANQPRARVLPDRGLIVAIDGSRGAARARVFFPREFLAEISRPSGFVRPFDMTLDDDGDTLSLHNADEAPLARMDRQRVAIGIDDLHLSMVTPAAPITSSALIAMLIPIVMWIVASVIGWIVVDALMIRPLRKLRAGVGAYRPGTVFDPVAVGPVPAQEIRDLGDTFGSLTRTLAAHEGELAEGLVRQTKLTREVHHRVKNNLQVIASLINFHARSARDPAVGDAYASIQRRVDALAVVHRHHYAEMEENRGLNARSVIGELAANLRATAPETNRLGIGLELEPWYVSQDTAVAIAFLVTEIVEMAMTAQAGAQLRISLRGGEEGRAVLRVSSPALIEGDALNTLIAERYGRILDGLSRQLRSKLHHDPLVGAYEIAVAVSGRD